VSARSLLPLAWRESRFARRRLLLFLSSITLGVAALVAVRGFSAALAEGVREQARVLMGADAQLRSGEPFEDAGLALVDSLEALGGEAARSAQFVSMALVPRTGGSRLVQVRAVEPVLPFYGEIETEPAAAWSALAAGGGVVVDPVLLLAVDAAVGDTLMLGVARFRIAGTLGRVPGDVEMASAFAPRVYMPYGALEATGLLARGARAEHFVSFRLPDPSAARALILRNRPVLEAERLAYRTADRQQEMLGGALDRLSSFLSLVGTLALLLGGIGVASAMGAYMARKADSVAVLRCLGATSGQVLGVYLLQAAVMGLVGSLAGAAIGIAVQWVLPAALEGLLPLEITVRIVPLHVLSAVGIGVWVALAFTLMPVLRARHVPPAAALRRNVDPIRPGRDPVRWSALAALGATVLAVVGLQAGDWRLGLAFSAGIGVALLGLTGLAMLATAAVRRLRAAALPYALRQGIANLHRPGNQTRAVVLALGFGVFLLGTVVVVQETLLRPLRPGTEGFRGNLLFWDVQPDQRVAVEEAIAEGGHRVLQQAPIVPMRLAEINGVDVREDGATIRGGRPARWAVYREYRSTFRDTTVASETVVAGRWRHPRARPAGALPPVSLERGVADDLRVQLGDTLVWDVQGVRVGSVVETLREVEWARFEPNFFAVFPEGVLDEAPHTWVVLAAIPGTGERGRVQSAVVRRAPNVSAIDLTQVQETVDGVVGRVSTAIRFLAGFSVLTGFVVLLGAVATGRAQRMRESVLLKTVGAVRAQIVGILATEYLALGVIASAAGTGLALLAGWGLARWMFRVGLGVPWPALAGLAAGTALLAAAVGLWASRDVVRRTPLDSLREE
jgi:putative ABC transport system permease protein